MFGKILSLAAGFFIMTVIHISLGGTVNGGPVPLDETRTTPPDGGDVSHPSLQEHLSIETTTEKTKKMDVTQEKTKKIVSEIKTTSVVHSGAGESSSLISAKAISHPTGNEQALELQSPWVNYGGTYSGAFVTLDPEGVCVVEGLVQNPGSTTSYPVALLPTFCRPLTKLVFSLHYKEANQYTRVDVHPDGRVVWAAETLQCENGCWLSLSGMIFSPSEATRSPFALQNSWSNIDSTGGESQTASFILHRQTCVLEGFVQGGSSHQEAALTQLPLECRPEKRLLFNTIGEYALSTDPPGTSRLCNLRVDVLQTGEVLLASSCSGTHSVSFSGISFSVGSPSQHSLALQNGWGSYAGGLPVYGSASVVQVGQTCVVQGLIEKGNLSTLALLPPSCRPRGRLIFNVINKLMGMPSRVDVFENGVISWVSGSDDNGWISLSGITFQSYAQQPLMLTSPWANYGDAYRSAEVSLDSEGVCRTEGLIRNPGSAMSFPIAVLPTFCRPSSKLIFNLYFRDAGQFTRVDVHPDGKIMWPSTSTVQCVNNCWLSLNGIVFSPGEAARVSLQPLNGWTNYGGDFQSVSYSLRGETCILEGFLVGGYTRPGAVVLTQLPLDCRPSKRLLFNAVGEDSSGGLCTLRVDALQNGDVILAESSCAGVVKMSLSGVSFNVGFGNSRPLRLTGGWVNYAQGATTYGTPSVVQRGKTCVVEGLIQHGTFGPLALLPPTCRPQKRLIFNVMNKALPSRVDVYPDGKISWESGSNDNQWLSLSGISFQSAYSPQTGYPINLGGEWTAYRNIYSLPRVLRDEGGVCRLDGLIKPTYNWISTPSKVATLPEQCRPEARMSFHVISSLNEPIELRLFPSGEIQYTGQRPGYLSLNGITFVPRDVQPAEIIPLNGWKQRGGDYSRLSFHVTEGICVLQGEISGGSTAVGGLIFQLPSGCRPSKQILVNGLFANPSGTYTNARVDIFKNGEVKVAAVSGNTLHNSWFSLSGISFPIENVDDPFVDSTSYHSELLQLVDGVKHYGGDYGSASVSLRGNKCTLDGLLQRTTTSWSVIGILPQFCRPRARLIFNVNNARYHNRVDVEADGTVRWVSGTEDSTYLSVTGITFEVNPNVESPCSHAGGFNPDPNKYYSITHVSVPPVKEKNARGYWYVLGVQQLPIEGRDDLVIGAYVGFTTVADAGKADTHFRFVPTDNEGEWNVVSRLYGMRLRNDANYVDTPLGDSSNTQYYTISVQCQAADGFATISGTPRTNSLLFSIEPVSAVILRDTDPLVTIPYNEVGTFENAPLNTFSSSGMIYLETAVDVTYDIMFDAVAEEIPVVGTLWSIFSGFKEAAEEEQFNQELDENFAMIDNRFEIIETRIVEIEKRMNELSAEIINQVKGIIDSSVLNAGIVQVEQQLKHANLYFRTEYVKKKIFLLSLGYKDEYDDMVDGLILKVSSAFADLRELLLPDFATNPKNSMWSRKTFDFIKISILQIQIMYQEIVMGQAYLHSDMYTCSHLVRLEYPKESMKRIFIQNLYEMQRIAIDQRLSYIRLESGKIKDYINDQDTGQILFSIRSAAADVAENIQNMILALTGIVSSRRVATDLDSATANKVLQNYLEEFRFDLTNYQYKTHDIAVYAEKFPESTTQLCEQMKRNAKVKAMLGFV